MADKRTHTHRASLARRLRSGGVGVLTVGLVAGGLAAGGLSLQVPAAEAAPGSPGAPSEPVPLYVEDFENAPGQNLGIRDYVSASGQSYNASDFWANRAECNGFVTSMTTATSSTSTDCAVGDMGNPAARLSYQNTVRQMISAISVLNGQDSSTNSGLAELANSKAPSGETVFETVESISLPSANRFVTFSVNAAATTCNQAQANLVFYAVNEAGDEIPLNTTPMNPCTQGTVIGATTAINTGPIYGATLFAQQSVLFNGSSLGVILRNSTNSADGNGNDFAIDDIRILDVSPQLDKSFTPARVPAGGTSTLTLTVTNTSDLAEKNGWSFTDTLPAGLTLADPVNVGGSCNADVSATAAGDKSQITNGVLASGEVSCTITVDVTSGSKTGSNPDSVTFANCASNISDQVGINDPDCAEVEFYSVPALEIEKTSDATSTTTIGDAVTYTVTATNTGNGDYTTENPAKIIDDLSGVLDDGDYQGDITVTRIGDVAYEAPQISWEGALPVGESVSLIYSVVLKEGGDLNVLNVAFVDDPNTPGEVSSCPFGSTQVACVVFDLSLLVTSKSVEVSDSPIVEQSVLTYTLSFENKGTAPAIVDHTDDLTDVLDDTVLLEQPVASDAALTVSAVENDQFDITGELAPGQVVTVSYQVAVRAQEDSGNFSADNFLVKNGEDVPGACESTNANCTVTPLPNLVVTKSVDPASGTPVVAGQELTYTLTFENTGNGAAAVAYTDYLEGVLDDAELIGSVAATGEGLAVSDLVDEALQVTGTLEPGTVATVVYKVKVKPDADQGDRSLANFLVLTDSDFDSGECVVNNPLCTENPIDPPVPTTPVPVTPTPSVTSPVTPTSPSDPIESEQPNSLAFTGGSATMLGIAGILALLLGGGVVLIAARRKKAQQE